MVLNLFGSEFQIWLHHNLIKLCHFLAGVTLVPLKDH